MHAFVNKFLTLEGSYLLNNFKAEITTLNSDFCVCPIGLHGVSSSSVESSPLQHCSCLCCENLILSPYDSFIVFESCDHCVSIYYAYSFSSSSVFLGHVKSF